MKYYSLNLPAARDAASAVASASAAARAFQAEISIIYFQITTAEHTPQQIFHPTVEDGPDNESQRFADFSVKFFSDFH